MRVFPIILLIIITILLIELYSCKKKNKKTLDGIAYEYKRAEINDILKKILVFWLEKRDEGLAVSTYFENKGIHKIAIYGMAELGRLLYSELEGTQVEVIYGIDVKADEMRYKVPIVRPEQVKKEMDAVIITPICFFSEIYDCLYKRLGDSVLIIGLDEVLYGLGESKK